MRLSYSSGASWSRCSWQWNLERNHKIKGRPTWAMIGGSVLHHVTEAHDLNDHGKPTPIPDIVRALDEQIEHDLDGSTYGVEDIKPGGRASKLWPDREDRAWWEHHLPGMVQSYLDWRKNTSWNLWMGPMGPAVEVPVHLEFDDAPDMVGYIDRVFENPATGELVVVDLKSGREPKNSQQLGVYRLGLWQEYGMLADWGAFYLGRQGGTGVVHNLREWSQERLEWEYGTYKRQIEAKQFVPHPGDACNLCGLQRDCFAVGGVNPVGVPLPWVRTQNDQ